MTATLLPPSLVTLNARLYQEASQRIHPAGHDASSFSDWLPAVSPLWRWDIPHLQLIQRELDRVTRGEIDRLMLFLPPRHSKSESTTVRYAAWRIEQSPALRVIIAAYNQTLASKFSRKVRRLVREHIPLSDERTAMDDWETNEGGGVRAVGVGGGVTGQGGDLIIIDDPVKSREEADSLTYRERVWDWYTDDLYTRLEPGAAIILIMTRWHQDDLAGRILNSEDGPNWTVVHLPALAMEHDALGRQPGEPLWPERYDAEAFRRIRASVGERGWYALYQGVPQPDGGAIFLADWWTMGRNRYDAGDSVTRNLTVGRWLSWDTGIKDNDESAYTACAVVELLPEYQLVVREVYRERLTFPTLPDVIATFAQRYNHDDKLQGILIEDKASGTSAYQTLMATAPGWIRDRLVAFQPSGSKEQRANQAAVWCRNGMVLLPHPSEHAPWLGTFETELFNAPQSTYMDQVDAFSQAIIYLEHYLSAGWHGRGTEHAA